MPNSSDSGHKSWELDHAEMKHDRVEKGKRVVTLNRTVLKEWVTQSGPWENMVSCKDPKWPSLNKLSAWPGGGQGYTFREGRNRGVAQFITPRASRTPLGRSLSRMGLVCTAREWAKIPTGYKRKTNERKASNQNRLFSRLQHQHHHARA